MPRPSDVVELHLPLDRMGQRLHRQIEDELRRGIRSGVLRSGVVLPSSRMLAEQLGVSRGVVVEAYGQLVAEGYLVVEPRRSPRVADSASAQLPAAPADSAKTCRERYNLNPNIPALDAFPRGAWSAALRRVLRETTDAELGSAPAIGSARLRDELAAYLSRARGCLISAEGLVVTQGATQALGLACAALRDMGIARVAVEDPSHRDIQGLIWRAGLSVVPIPVDDDGIDVSILERSGVEAVLLTPAHQFPTGAVLSPVRRGALMSWIDGGNRFVIEDDYDAELRYGGSPVGALQGLRPSRVVYTGSVSKALLPSLRIGWLAAPAEFATAVVGHKRFTDLGSPTIDQLTFLDFLKRGEFDRHLRRVRLRYRRQRDAAIAVLAAHVPWARVTGVAAGLHLVVQLPDCDEDIVRARVRSAGIAVGWVADHCVDARWPATLLIGFALHDERTLTRAIRALAAAVNEASA